MNETNGNGKKRTRRNFEKILADLKQYCEVKRDVLQSLNENAVDKEHSDMMIGQLAAFNDVLKRIEAR